jgi:hypothetical protein
VQQFLRTLTGITAIALAGAIIGAAQNSQPAQTGQAAPADKPAEKKKNYKDQQEYTLYDSATKEPDATKKLGLLTQWKEKYPDSDFKMERTMLFLDAYQRSGQYAKMIDTAKEILAIDPKELHALYWITLLTPQLNLNSADGLDTGEKASNGLLGAEAPAGTPPADWEKAKKTTDAIAYKTLGWIWKERGTALGKKAQGETGTDQAADQAAALKAYTNAEQNFLSSLKMEPNSGEVDYWLGTTILLEKKPERMSEALFYIARAVAYDGPGAMTPQQRQPADPYLTKVYSQIHGDTSGLAELKGMAKTNPAPPADFKIKTAAEIAAEKDEELKKTNPALALWMNIKGQLLAQDGEKYFDAMKGAALPGGAGGVTKFKGWLLSAKEVKSKAGRITYPELLVSMEGKDQPADVTLKLVGGADGTTPTPLAGKPDVGVEIEFEGVGDAFTKDPAFMVTFDVEKAKITGLKEAKPAPTVHHTAHK